jgi:hypothetical protein
MNKKVHSSNKETFSCFFSSSSLCRDSFITVRAGIMGQISTLTLDGGAIGFLNVLLQRGDWLILI